MTRIAILGGGISGLTAAYELELARKRGAAIDWHLYEATDRLGGIIETARHTTPEGTYILEGGPDAWVTEKPWATELALELGLEDQLIYSNDATRKTYIRRDHQLIPIPDRMRLMVPEDLSALEASPLFTASAKAAYTNELNRAEELRAASPETDESIASFVRRHFGEEVLTTLAAPLLSGVFGGNVHKLSVRAVMPQFVAMEREHGSLIAALQSKSKQRTNEPQPIFTTLHNGTASLVDALIARLPQERLFLSCNVEHLWDDPRWQIIVDDPKYRPNEHPHPLSVEHYDELIICLPLKKTRELLAAADYDLRLDKLLPTDASSAILATFTWPADLARTFTLPPGFGFLVPQPSHNTEGHDFSRAESADASRGALAPEVGLASPPQAEPWTLNPEPSLLACTFVDQKFPHRAPAGARILRAFFGSPTAEALATQPDATIAAAALTQLRNILGPIPNPSHTEIRRLPRSLPQYEVGHLDRIAQLDSLIARTPGLHLLGNGYRGVGLPDLIRDGRAAARALCTAL